VDNLTKLCSERKVQLQELKDSTCVSISNAKRERDVEDDDNSENPKNSDHQTPDPSNSDSESSDPLPSFIHYLDRQDNSGVFMVDVETLVGLQHLRQSQCIVERQRYRLSS